MNTLQMNDSEVFRTIPEGEGFAICVYLLQYYADLSFVEAYTYAWVEQFHRPADFEITRQALHSRLRNARRKIRECEAPVLEMIAPYVESAQQIWV